MIRVQVTQSDIDEGTYNSCTRCPVALALRRRLDRDDVMVMPSYVDVGPTVVNLSKRMKAWINRFDSGKPVAPIAFLFPLLVSEDRPSC